MSFTLFTTDFEPPSVSYSEMFSWQGEQFEKRPNQKSQIAYRRKRSLRVTDYLEAFSDSNFTSKPTLVPEDGVFVIAESIAVLNEYLVGSPRDPFRVNRRIFIIVITNTTEPEFDKLAKKFLARLWRVYGVADAILITPCNNDKEVSVEIVCARPPKNIKRCFSLTFRLLADYSLIFPISTVSKQEQTYFRNSRTN